MSVTLRDFQPINTWEPDEYGSRWGNSNGSVDSDSNEPEYIIDMTTDRKYWNDTQSSIRSKCFALTIFTPLIHSIASVVNVVYRILKLVLFANLWMDKAGEKSYSFGGRLLDTGKDLLRIITTPLALIGLECAAIYGIFSPYNGRKLYASIERAQYGNSVAAPCFQPDPEYHALDGDPRVRSAW